MEEDETETKLRRRSELHSSVPSTAHEQFISISLLTGLEGFLTNGYV